MNIGGIDAWTAELARPTPARTDDVGREECFDPWSLFPLYGTYSSEFDDCAILVLKNLVAAAYDGESLPHEMFREMLCVAGLCDYGTSPRVCFPTPSFRALLPVAIEKWCAYREAQWA